jgi:hypothetical protein
MPIPFREQSGFEAAESSDGRWLSRRGLPVSWLDLPHAFAIVADRAVGGKFAHARGVENRLARPCLGIAPEGAHSLLRVDVGLVIGEKEEGIVMEEILDKRAEWLGVAAAECSTRDEVNDFAQRGILFVMIAPTIAA